MGGGKYREWHALSMYSRYIRVFSLVGSKNQCCEANLPAEIVSIGLATTSSYQIIRKGRATDIEMYYHAVTFSGHQRGILHTDLEMWPQEAAGHEFHNSGIARDCRVLMQQ